MMHIWQSDCTHYFGRNLIAQQSFAGRAICGLTPELPGRIFGKVVVVKVFRTLYLQWLQKSPNAAIPYDSLFCKTLRINGEDDIIPAVFHGIFAVPLSARHCCKGALVELSVIVNYLALGGTDFFSLAGTTTKNLLNPAGHRPKICDHLQCPNL